MTERPTVMGLTLGNYIQIGLFVVGGLAAFVKLEADQRTQQSQLARMEQNSREIEARMDQNTRELEARIRAVEVLQASQSSDLRNIQIGINEIKAGLDRLSDSGRVNP
jgi:hypothetical protein